MLITQIRTLLTGRPERSLAVMLVLIAILGGIGVHTLWQSSMAHLTINGITTLHSQPTAGEPTAGSAETCEAMFTLTATAINDSPIMHISQPGDIVAVNTGRGETECTATVTVRTLFGNSRQELTYRTPVDQGGLPKPSYTLQRTDEPPNG